MATTDEETDVWTDPATAWLEQTAKGFSKDADELRASTDRAAKALGGLATAGLTAVGIAKVGAVYGGRWYWVILLFAGFAVMAGSIVTFVIRLWKANRPLALTTNVSKDTKPTVIDEHEDHEIQRIYGDAMAHAPFTEGVETLQAYELRADEWDRDALYTPDSPISKRRLAHVARMRAEIEKAEERAKLVVIRRRMNRALADWLAIVLAIAFVVALVAFAVAADALESERTKEACVAAIKQGATELPPDCKTYVE
jgi:hypothetical protein